MRGITKAKGAGRSKSPFRAFCCHAGIAPPSELDFFIKSYYG
jgi:hypothetical protein